jgi:hypothetical protein
LSGRLLEKEKTADKKSLETGAADMPPGRGTDAGALEKIA